METLTLKDFLGSDIRYRATARKIYDVLKEVPVNVIDLEGVTFVSRSVADELCVISETRNIELVGASGFPKSMIEIVSEGRSRKRERVYDSNVVECNTMEELSMLLLSDA